MLGLVIYIFFFISINPAFYSTSNFANTHVFTAIDSLNIKVLNSHLSIKTIIILYSETPPVYHGRMINLFSNRCVEPVKPRMYSVVTAARRLLGFYQRPGVTDAIQPHIELKHKGQTDPHNR